MGDVSLKKKRKEKEKEGIETHEAWQHAQGRHPARSVHQGGQCPTMDHAGPRIADNLRAVRQDDRQSIAAGAVNAQTKYLTMPER